MTEKPADPAAPAEAPPKSSGRVFLVVVDESPELGVALRYACVRAKKTGGRVALLYVIEPADFQQWAGVNELMREEARQVPEDMEGMVSAREDVDATLREASATLKDMGVKEVNIHAREGDPADAILDVAEEKDCDLIVVGNKGMTGAKRFLLGSVPNKVSHHAPCSVLIIRTT